jgi:ribonuclease HIII
MEEFAKLIMKNNRYFYEQKLQSKNKTKIAGVDEVGRGC